MLVAKLNWDALHWHRGEGILDQEWDQDEECLREWGTVEQEEGAGEADLSELLSSIFPPWASHSSFCISRWEALASPLRVDVSPPSSCQVW